MIEEFKTTKTLRQVLANEISASQTWARLTWEQRVAGHPTIHANKPTSKQHITNYIVTPINALFRRPIRVATLSQMQF